MNITAVPFGSKISSESTPSGSKIQWKNPDNPLYRFGIGAFILFWLGGWFTGEVSTAQKLWSDFQQGKPMEAFLLFWLCGWTVGGFFAAFFLITLLRGSGRSELVLGNYELTYRPGGVPISALYRGRTRKFGNPFKMLRGGETIIARKQDITKLQISNAGDQPGLTFDIGAQRVEVGEYLTGPEKEWLHKTIQSWLGQSGSLATGTMTLSSPSPLSNNRKRWGSLATLVPIVLLIAVFFILTQKGIIQFFGMNMAKVAKQTTKGTGADAVCMEWIAGLRAEEDVARARLRHTDYSSLSADQAHKKGLNHDRRREYADAIVAWEWEVSKNPDSTNGWNDIGYAYQVLNNPELALKCADKSTAIDPRFGHGHYTAGRALLIMGRYSEARDRLGQAISNGWQQNGDSQMLLGLALRELGDEAGAVTAFQRALDIRPNHAETKSYLSGMRFKPTWPDCHNRLTAPVDATKADKS